MRKYVKKFGNYGTGFSGIDGMGPEPFCGKTIILSQMDFGWPDRYAFQLYYHVLL